MSEKRGRPEGDSTPFITPAISTRHPSRIPQASATIPRKGILKQTPRAKSTDAFHDRREPPSGPHIRATVSYTLANDFFQLPTATVAPTASPRPTVGFSEKNVVSIIGDTSDEYESDRRASLISMPRNGTLPQILETTLVEPPARMVE